MDPIVQPGPLPISVSIPGGMEPKRCVIIDGFVPEDAVSVRLQCGPSIEEKDDIALCITFRFTKKSTTFSMNSYIAAAWEKSNEQIVYYKQKPTTSKKFIEDTEFKQVELSDQVDDQKSGPSNKDTETKPNESKIGVDWKSLVNMFGIKSAAKDDLIEKPQTEQDKVNKAVELKEVTDEEQISEVKDVRKMPLDEAAVISKDEVAKYASTSKDTALSSKNVEQTKEVTESIDKQLKKTEVPKKRTSLQREKVEKLDSSEATTTKNLKLTEVPKKELPLDAEARFRELREGELANYSENKRLLAEQAIKTQSDEATTSKGTKLRETSTNESTLERDKVIKWWQGKEFTSYYANKSTEEGTSKNTKLTADSKDALLSEREKVIKWWENATNNKDKEIRDYPGTRSFESDSGYKELESVDKCKNLIEWMKSRDPKAQSDESTTSKDTKRNTCCKSKFGENELDIDRIDEVGSTSDLPSRPRCDNSCQSDADSFFLLPLPEFLKYYLTTPKCCVNSSSRSLPCENCKKNIKNSNMKVASAMNQSSDTTLVPDTDEGVKETEDTVVNTEENANEIENGPNLIEKSVKKTEEMTNETENKENKVKEKENKLIEEVKETKETVEAAKVDENKEKPYLGLGIKTINLRKPTQVLRIDEDNNVINKQEEKGITEENNEETDTTEETEQIESKQSEAYFKKLKVKKADTEQKIKIFEDTQKKWLKSQTKAQKTDIRDKNYFGFEKKDKSQQMDLESDFEISDKIDDRKMTTSMQEVLKVMEESEQKTLSERPKATPKEPTTSRRSFLQILSGRSSNSKDEKPTRSSKIFRDFFKSKDSKSNIRKDSKVSFKEDKEDQEMLIGEADGAFISSNLMSRGAECRIIILCTDKGFIMTLEDVDICEIDHRTDYDLISFLVLTGDFDVIDAGVVGAGGPTRWLIHATDFYQPWEQSFVTVLTDETFEKIVFTDDKPQFVTFYMNKCQFHRALEYAAPSVQNKVSFSTIDALVNLDTVERLSLTTVPIILYFPSGDKSFDNFEVYDGVYSKEGMVEWLLHKIENKEGPPPGSGTKNPYSQNIHMVGQYRGKKLDSKETATEENTEEVDASTGDENYKALEINRMYDKEKFGEILFKSEYDISLSDSCIAKERRFRTFLDVVIPSQDKDRPSQFNYEDLLGLKVPVIECDSSDEYTGTVLERKSSSKLKGISRSKQTLSKCEYTVDDRGRLIKLSDKSKEDLKTVTYGQNSKVDTKLKAKSEIMIPMNLNQGRDRTIRRRRRRCLLL